MSFLACNLPQPDHVANDCNNFEKGGFSSVAILLKGHGITDFESPTQWNAAITSGKARIVNRIKADLPAPSPQKVDNPVACGAQQILDGFDWTLHWVDANNSGFNDAFYEALNVQVAAIAFYNCPHEVLYVVESSATFTAFPLKSASNKEFQSYDATAEWTTGPSKFPDRYDAPTGIFPDPNDIN